MPDAAAGVGVVGPGVGIEAPQGEFSLASAPSPSPSTSPLPDGAKRPCRLSGMRSSLTTSSPPDHRLFARPS